MKLPARPLNCPSMRSKPTYAADSCGAPAMSNSATLVPSRSPVNVLVTFVRVRLTPSRSSIGVGSQPVIVKALVAWRVIGVLFHSCARCGVSICRFMIWDAAARSPRMALKYRRYSTRVALSAANCRSTLQRLKSSRTIRHQLMVNLPCAGTSAPRPVTTATGFLSTARRARTIAPPRGTSCGGFRCRRPRGANSFVGVPEVRSAREEVAYIVERHDEHQQQQQPHAHEVDQPLALRAEPLATSQNLDQHQ